MPRLARALSDRRNTVPSIGSAGLVAAWLACGAIASFASAAPASEGAEAAPPEPSPAVQERISQFKIGLANYGASSVRLVAELDEIPNHAPRSEARRACYDQVLPVVEPLLDEAKATPQLLETGHQCTLESDDACWMPVFDKVDAALADVISRMDDVTGALEACRKLES